MELLIRKSFKYRIYPAKSQITTLENHFSMCRHLYNRNLAERIDAYKRVGNGETPGFPKFKKRGQWDSITYPQYHKRPSSVITIPKIGKVRLIHHREMPEDAKIKTLTITKDAGKWFACFSVELPMTSEPKPGLSDPVGIDLGLIDFVHTSDGSHIPAPIYLRKKEKKLRRLQRRLAKTQKGSEKYHRILRAIRKCHYRIRCQRNDFLHKTANELLTKSDLMFYEDLNISGMIRRPSPRQDENGKYLPNNASAKAALNKSIADAGWYKFIAILTYKAVGPGKKIFAVPPHHTSQKCSACDEIVKKTLSVRTHRCSCGFVANRDHNAALNILRVGMHTLQAQT